MKIKIVYESKTGNTKMIAQAIKEACEIDNTVELKSIEEASEVDKNETDIFFLGSWTNKGDAGDLMKKYCKGLEGKSIAVFGTAGFGGSPDYYKNLEGRFINALPDSNKVIGSFYSQGKMPMGVRNRYEAMLQKNPEDANLEVSIENFDAAQFHPDKNDLEDAKKFAAGIIKELKSV